MWEHRTWGWQPGGCGVAGCGRVGCGKLEALDSYFDLLVMDGIVFFLVFSSHTFSLAAGTHGLVSTCRADVVSLAVAVQDAASSDDGQDGRTLRSSSCFVPRLEHGEQVELKTGEEGAEVD